MKKVKILLGSLALVAVAGSTLAFKADKFSSLYVWKKSSATATTCPLVTSGLLTITTATTVGTIQQFATYKTVNVPPATTECVNTFRITAEQ